MKALTYLIYCIFWEAFTLGGSTYLVVWKNRSGWWIILGLLMSASAYGPGKWIHGKAKEDCD